MRLKLIAKIVTQNSAVTRIAVAENGAIAGTLALDSAAAPLVMRWLNQRDELLKAACELLDDLGKADQQRRKWQNLNRLVESLEGEK